MKIIENLTLSIDMSGVWSGNSISVTAKIWNGKITKTGTLTSSFSMNRLTLLNMDVNNSEQARFEIAVDRKMNGSTSTYVDYFTTNVRTAMEAGWKKTREYSNEWSNATVNIGGNKTIHVPGSNYLDFPTFTISGEKISSIETSKNHGNFPRFMSATIHGSVNSYSGYGVDTTAAYEQGKTDMKNDIGDILSSTSHGSYPLFKAISIYAKDNQTVLKSGLECYTGDVYEAGQKYITDRIAASRNVGKYITQGTKTVYVPNGYYGQGNITFTIDIGGSSGGGSCCFPAGAPVLLANGATAPIETLTLGTPVTGYDLDRQEFCDTEVMSTIQKKHRSDIYEIQREDGVSFLMTANHVVLTKNGWKAIDAERGQQAVPDEVVTELTNEDELLRSDGNYIKINNIRYRDDLQDQNVYNIDVEDIDTYIVYDIVVHNECSGG